MFTGLVRERGRVAKSTPSAQGGRRLVLEHSRELGQGLEIGSSLAVSGVCLTAVKLASGRTWVELAPETLARTTLGDLAVGDEVNLEPSLSMGDPLGGHWVQGHVDGTVKVLRVEEKGEHREVDFALPGPWLAYVVEKGSVALDGVSLTVARCLSDGFRVALIPHTLEVTTLGLRRPGDLVNLEVDILAKYVERLLAVRLETRSQ